MRHSFFKRLLLSKGVVAYSVVVLLIVSAVFFVWRYFGPRDANRPSVVSPAVAQGVHGIGTPDGAEIQMFVYTDFECEYCKDFHTITLPKLLKTYGSTLFIAYKEFPLAIHPGAYRKAEAAECAYAQGGDSAFFKYVEQMFAILPENGIYEDNAAALSDAARLIGLDTDVFEVCLETGQKKEKVDQDIAEGTAAGVTLTPSMLLRRGDKTVLISGNYFGYIQAAIRYLRL